MTGSTLARSALMTPESVLLIDGDTVAETARPEPVLQELEGRPVASVIDELEAALEK